MTTTSTPVKGQTITLTRTAPVSAPFIGRTGTVTRVMPNAIFLNVEGHGPAIVHLAWGTKSDRQTLGWTA